MNASHSVAAPVRGTAPPHRQESPDPGQTDVLLLLRDAEATLGRDRDAACRSLSRALALLRQGAAAPQRGRAELPAWQLRRLLAYIDARLGTPLRSAELAKLLTLSVSHFSHAFRNSVGMAPGAYVARRRIESACRAMLSSDASLADIALSHGFCDQSHFTRTFRRWMGLSPRVWRRQCHGRPAGDSDAGSGGKLTSRPQHECSPP